MRLGIAHHFGWAVAVTATGEGTVVDRRRLELIGPGLPAAPIHSQETRDLGDRELTALVERVRASSLRAAAAALDELAACIPAPISSISLRGWPNDFPTAIATLRRAPYESRADSVMYRQVLAELATERGWAVGLYDAGTVLEEAAALLGPRAREVLHGPRERLGPPWTKDHRLALAAVVLAREGHPNPPPEQVQLARRARLDR